ncbi:hypothetical protein RRG08_032604 [Elysia crispata]|uniref:Uncharacterized protein n=1 Tax=Elysia crispata TaxID=231223 RepID=A0AAE0XZN2_9GAST|nr:hypothetical protein RRG08_032604 [Elysia crispata]
MRKAARGWTHPNHWKVAIVGTLCEILALSFVGVAIFVTPFFSDRRGMSMTMLNIMNLNVKCEMDYCYDSTGESKFPPLQPGQEIRHVFHVTMKPGSGWLHKARILLLVSSIVNMLSLSLILLVFWPVVLCGKVLNKVLLMSRILDFLSGPVKFVSAFFFIWHISAINESYSWWKYDGLLQMDPLPIGLVLFSYILQTLAFVCSTVAMDKGAKGQLNHLALMKQRRLLESLESVEPQEFQRVSYHPITSARSSRLLSEVADHFGKSDIKTTESNV